jgi:endonuclease III
MMKEHGLDVEPTSEDEEIAAKIILAYADDPSKTSKKVSTKRAAALPPAALIMTHNILTQFGHSVVESAVQVRHLVTNKLIEETENPDPRVRIRALELLGKISDVGLFTDKTEVTITHRTTDELRESLRSKLSKLVNLEEDVIDAEFVDPEAIDIDVELGIEDESDE